MFIQLSVECLSCFQGLAVVSSTARNSPVQGFEHPFPMVLSICLGMVLLGHMVILCINSTLFTIVDAWAVYEHYNYSTSSRTFFFLFISCFKKISGHPSGCELVSPCGFDVRFPND